MSHIFAYGLYYIAIPHTTRKTKRRPKPVEEKIVVVDKEETEQSDDTVPELVESDSEIVEGETDDTEKDVKSESTPTRKSGREMTHKEYFELVLYSHRS